MGNDARFGTMGRTLSSNVKYESKALFNENFFKMVGSGEGLSEEELASAIEELKAGVFRIESKLKVLQK
jgi:hypothetical protein